MELLTREIKLDKVSPEGVISGYLSTYNQIDSDNTYMMAGCFDESLKKFEADPYLPLLWQHDRWSVIGRWIELKSDEHGLFGKAQLTLDDPLAKNALVHLMDGSIRGLSIGFMANREDFLFDKKSGAYGIKDADLMECSVVTFPANKGARVTNVKCEDSMNKENNPVDNEKDPEFVDMEAFRKEMSKTITDTVNTELEAIKKEISSLKNPVNMAANEDKNTAYEKQFRNYIQKGEFIRDDPVSPPISGNTGVNANGGYLVPDGLDKRVVELLGVMSVIRRNASIITPEGNKYERPYKKTGITSGWVGETTARTQTDAQTYDMISAELGELYAFPMYTQRFLADSWYNVTEAFIRDLALSFTDKEEEAFISGNGTNKPKGILTYTMSTANDKSRDWNNIQMVKSGSATDITLDSLIKIKDSLNVAYRSNAKWFMNTNTYTALQSLLKDLDGRRVFGSVDVSTNAPTLLLGYPIEIDDYLPDVAANANPVLFGDMRSAYAVLDRPGIGVVRDELTNKPYIGMYSIKRVGGLIQDYRAIKVLNIAVNS